MENKQNKFIAFLTHLLMILSYPFTMAFSIVFMGIIYFFSSLSRLISWVLSLLKLK